jgi:hypothetical protein
MAMKRFLLISAAVLLLISTTVAHRAASDEEDAAPTIGDINTNIPNEEAPFIENLVPKGEQDEYQGPKDFQYCKK